LAEKYLFQKIVGCSFFLIWMRSFNINIFFILIFDIFSKNTIYSSLLRQNNESAQSEEEIRSNLLHNSPSVISSSSSFQVSEGDSLISNTSLPISSVDQLLKKKKIRRKNTEEYSFCCFNIFYLFFCYYFCKIHPVTDDDIPGLFLFSFVSLIYSRTRFER
jgi:hypothetical protein